MNKPVLIMNREGVAELVILKYGMGAEDVLKISWWISMLKWGFVGTA